MTNQRILDWLEEAPTGARLGQVAPLVRAYFQAELSAENREVLELALTMLVDDRSHEVRRALAEVLALYEDAPRHLIVALSQDLPVVSEPIFRRSPCLLDGELIAAVSGSGERIQQAIAARPWISYPVAGAIAADGDRSAILVMLANAGADLDADVFAVLARRFGTDGDVREALFSRQDLPLAVRQMLVASLGDKLNALVSERAWMKPSRARAVVREACDKATVRLVSGADEDELVALVGHLRTSGQLTTALLVRSMCAGEIRFLEAVLADLSGLPASRVYALLLEGRPAALRALFNRAGLPQASHAAFISALEVWRELDYDGGAADVPRFGLRMVERILTRYQQLAPGEVDDLLALFRRLAAEAARERLGTLRAERRNGASGWIGRRAA